MEHVGVGLHNFGATCAINTLIQILTHTATIRMLLLDASTTAESESAPATTHTRRLCTQLADVVDKLYVQHKPVAPCGLVQTIFAMFPDNFNEHEQMDICELWMLISQKLAEEMACVVSPESGCVSPFQVHTHIDPMHVQKYVNQFNANSSCAFLKAIQSVQLGVVQCEDCSNKSWNVEVLTSHAVEVPTNSDSKSLGDLLLRNYRIDKLKDWTCEKCKHVGALKQAQIYMLPKILMVSIKRFFMDSTGRFFKINNPVDIQEHLSFEINGVSQVYRLAGIANHYGMYSGGHYNAHVRVRDDAWECIDDVHVSAIPNTNFLLNNQSAYLMCYELQ